KSLNSYKIVIDRVAANNNDENLSRIFDSVQTAFYEGNGECQILIDKTGNWETHQFNNKFELDGLTFEEPNVHFFSFNNPFGACKKCDGFGSVIGIDKDLVVPNKNLSIYDNAIACWRGESMSEWKENFLLKAFEINFPVHKPYKDLTPENIKILWDGTEKIQGINQFFEFIEANAYKIQYRVLLSRYRGKTVCPDCFGTRLRKDAN